MSLRTIIETEPLSVEAQLLRVGRSMQPPTSAYRKTLVGLGITASATTGASLANAAAGTGAVSAKSAVVAWLGGTAAKGIAVGFIAGATVLGATRVGTTPRQATHETTPSGSSVAKLGLPYSGAIPASGKLARELGSAPERLSLNAPSETRAVVKLGSTDQTSESEPSVSCTPTHTAAQSAAQPVLGTVTGRISLSGKSLGAEVELIDGVRDALARQQPERALDLLMQHKAQFRNASLGEEAMFLRARALEQLGRHADAAEALRQFRRAYPDSTLSEQP